MNNPSAGAPQNLPRANYRTLFLLLGVLGLVLLIDACLFLAAPREIKFEVPPDAPVMDGSWTLKSLDGRETKLSDWRGHPVFLSFWASWCGPCREEMPTIMNMREAVKDRGVVVALVSLDESEADARAAVEELKIDPALVYFPVQKPPDLFESNWVPRSFILTPDGRLAVTHFGAYVWDKPEPIDFLRALASGS